MTYFEIYNTLLELTFLLQKVFHILLGWGASGFAQTPTFLENMLIFMSSLFLPSVPLPLCHVKHTPAPLHVYQWQMEDSGLRGQEEESGALRLRAYRLQRLQAQGPPAKESCDKSGLKNGYIRMGEAGGRQLAVLFSPACCCITMHIPTAHLMKIGLAAEKDISSLKSSGKEETFSVQ